MADTLSDAQEWFREATDALSEARRQQEEDLAFSDPADPQQWDSDEKRARESDPGGARPCLTFDQVGQYVATVAGQIEQSTPSLHSLPASGGADIKVSEQLDGHFRHIEYASRAVQHYMRALTSAARAGVGYLIVRPEYTDRALNYQEPRISSEGDPLKVLFDPWSVELDGSDAERGQLLTAWSHRGFERQFGTKADKVSFGDTTQTVVDDQRKSIITCEEWRKVNETVNCIVFQTADGDEQSLDEYDYWQAKKNDPAMAAVKVLHTYSDKRTCVKWVRMSGAEILTPETEYPADGIGIVPVYGYVGWSDNRMHVCGVSRRGRSAQRAYNYHMSEIRAYMALAPKAPWIASVRAIKGLERLWDRAGVDSRATLPFNDRDDLGEIAAPERPQVSTNLTNHIQGAEQALHDIQAALGMYQASLGAPSNETSGIAIDARKKQGEAATSHFPAHLAASVGQVGKLCMQMIPRLIDTKRQLRILGVDQTPGSVTVDPKQAEPLQETEQGLSINPAIGQYDVRVVVGTPFTTQRQQAQEAFTEMMRANPALTPAIAPLWAGTLDIPDADRLVQVLTAAAPPEIRAVLQPQGSGQGPTTAQLQAQLQQLQQALQQATQIAHEAQADAMQAHQELASKAGEHEDKGTELAINAYNAETARLKVTGANAEQTQAIVRDLLNQMLTSPDPLGDEATAPMPPMPSQAAQPIPPGGQPAPVEATEVQQ